ncbi:MAG: hypothetical protein WBQ25_04670 [Nitrososphaeraceae archaeon]
MPGVGKSQLAVEFAYRYAYQFEKGVYWIQGADPTTWVKQLVHIAKNELGLEISESKDNSTNNDKTNVGNISEQDKKFFFKLKNYCNEFGNQMLIIIDKLQMLYLLISYCSV